METKEIIGEVQNIKSNRKSFTMNNDWFNNYTLLPEDLEKGQTIKVTYVIKEVNGKKFNNIKKLEPVIKEPLLDKLIPNQTANTILMNVKDIIVAELDRGNGKERYFTEDELTHLTLRLTENFVKAYKEIK